MQDTPKRKRLIVCVVNLGSAAEAALHAKAEAVGGCALGSEVAEVLGVLERTLALLETLEAEGALTAGPLPPIIQDRLPA